MPTPPNDTGIMNAMKSMKTIAGKSSAPIGFPRPPIDFVGTLTGPGAKKGRPLKKKNGKKSSGPTTTTKNKSSLKSKPSTAPSNPRLIHHCRCRIPSLTRTRSSSGRWSIR